MRPTRILVLRFSSIGDVVLTSPVFRQLHAQLDGETEIHFLTKQAFVPLVEYHPAIHQAHGFTTDLTEVFDALMDLEFDYVIDLHRNVRSSIAKRKLQRLNFTVKKRNWDKWLLVRTGIDRLKGEHIVERYLDTARGFGLKDDGRGLDLVIPADAEVSADTLPAGLRKGFVALALGAAHEGKRMTEGQLRAICQNSEWPVVLLGGEGDVEMALRLAEEFGEHVWNAAGKFSILQSSSLVRQAKAVVAGDTGLMHIAAALRIPLVSVWGCTSPALGMSPWRPHPSSVSIEPEGRKRRPCSKLGNRCKYGMEQKCISTIPPTRISDALNALASG